MVKSNSFWSNKNGFRICVDSTWTHLRKWKFASLEHRLAVGLLGHRAWSWWWGFCRLRRQMGEVARIRFFREVGDNFQNGNSTKKTSQKRAGICWGPSSVIKHRLPPWLGHGDFPAARHAWWQEAKLQHHFCHCFLNHFLKIILFMLIISFLFIILFIIFIILFMFTITIIIPCNSQSWLSIITLSLAHSPTHCIPIIIHDHSIFLFYPPKICFNPPIHGPLPVISPSPEDTEAKDSGGSVHVRVQVLQVGGRRLDRRGGGWGTWKSQGKMGISIVMANMWLIHGHLYG